MLKCSEERIQISVVVPSHGQSRLLTVIGHSKKVHAHVFYPLSLPSSCVIEECWPVFACLSPRAGHGEAISQCMHLIREWVKSIILQDVVYLIQFQNVFTIS